MKIDAWVLPTAALLTLLLYWVITPTQPTHAADVVTVQQYVDLHNEYDTAFVAYTRDVQELSKNTSPWSSDFGQQVDDLWRQHGVEEKWYAYKRIRERLSNRSIDSQGEE